MLVSCCGYRKTHRLNSKSYKTAPHRESATPKATTQLVVEELSKDATANGGHVRNKRRSLPDVVLPSAVISAHHLFTDQRPSLQIDTKMYRRPTLDLETTARLARSESTGFDEAGEISKSIQLISSQSKISPLTDPNQPQSLCTSASDNTTTTPQKYNGVGIEPDSVPHQKRGVFFRLISFRTIRNPFRKRECSNREESRSDEMTTIETDTKRSKMSHSTELLKEVEEQEQEIAETPTNETSAEADSSVDGLGHLPPVATKPFSSPFVMSTVRDVSFQPNSRFHRASVLGNAISHIRPMPPMRNAANLRRGSLCVFSHVDELIVTPFAQILASLRRVRSNFILLTNVSSTKDSRFGTSYANLEDYQASTPATGNCEQIKPTASETLEELEWCLERLENIQTHRSVSDMATSKFRKMLSKELNQFTDGGRNSKQISEYICSTFLDSNEADLPVASGDRPDESSTENTFTAEPCQADGPAAETPADGDRLNRPDTTVSANKAATTTTVVADPTTQSHTPDISQALLPHLAPFGVVSNQPEQLDRLLAHHLDEWGLDIFDLVRLTPNPLTCVFYKILQKRSLIKRFSIPEMNLVRYMNLIEENYRAVPYHNRVHAADVVQSTHVLLNTSALTTVFTDLEVLAVLFACAIHDVDHPGLTNQYLINTNDQLAILYNDTSVLENHHLAVAFQLLTRPGCDMFEHLPRKQRLSLRRMSIDMVLATDMSKHMSLLADLKTMVETKKVAGSGILTLDNYSDRIQILQNMIHCADLSNPAKPLELYRKWNTRVMEEHFRQGDRERERGLELSPMCDRTTASVEKSQVSFIDYIAHPLWETWSELVHPDAQSMLDTLDDNRQWYHNQTIDESASSPSPTVTRKGSNEHA